MKNSFLNLNGELLDEVISIIGIGTWDWDLKTNKVVYSTAWAQILGYNVHELPQVVDTWERMVFKEDLPAANKAIEEHLAGRLPTYEAEFRMRCKDGSFVWAQDKGKVIEFNADGTPRRFVGVLQDVSRLKDVELALRDNQASLDLAVNVAGLGTWDWDIPGDFIKYNDEYLQMLGYSQSDMDGSMDEWEGLNHPADLPRASKLLEAYIDGEINSYECEIRMRRKDGKYIWTRDVGKIIARDENGKPSRILGGHLNIDALKRSEEGLTTALEKLEDHRQNLEQEIEDRTKELVDHDKMLWTVNQISRKLLTVQPEQKFDVLVNDCLRLLGESINRSRVYIWKDSIREDGEICCTQIYEWVLGVDPIQGIEEYESVPYCFLPGFAESTRSGKCLNSLIKNLSEAEKAILLPQGIKTILIAPISVDGNRWGFIGVDNCENEELFTEIEENMLFMSGSMLANTIEKMDNEGRMREMEERNQAMLDAMPLCCNLWTRDLVNMRCNEEAVRLFDMPSQAEYLKNFYKLNPEFQPAGGRSKDLALAYVKKAFDEGYFRFEWLHQKLDGTPVPAEITLVRIKSKGDYIVVGYTRDLREEKAMIKELQGTEEDLRNARDEALLSSKAKSNFLANMSHEIRTPMNAISGLAEIILRESPEGKAAEYAWSIRNACGNLLSIINDILDISKIESGKLEIVPARYELASLINDVITIARMRLGNKQLVFLTFVDSRLPASLIGDEIRIKQVLINILSNAIKFTQTGHICLRVTGEVEGENVRLKFSVSDTGVGIKDSDLQRLFAEFERVNTTKNRSIEGTGLGLAISKRLCEMMGGEIKVNTVFGQGSTFIAVIPQTCTNYEKLSLVENKRSVLLYEPRELYRISAAESIENLGCSCDSCSNQSELYDSILKKPYDFILTAMLHLKKVQLLVKKNSLPSKVAVMAEYAESVNDDSIYTVLFPVNCLQLSDMLNGHKSDGVYSALGELSESFTAPLARVLVVDDNPVNLSVAKGLMAPYKFKIDTAINGIEAVYMVKHNKYDLVFMDHMMPEMDGIDATNAIRAFEDPYFKSLPIVALTANALMGTREMFLREGMDDFLAKPIELNKLAGIISKWLPAEMIVKNSKELNVKSADKALAIKIEGVNTAQGLLALGGNAKHYMNILGVYYADGIKKSRVLIDFVNEKNLKGFRTEIHALKSASASIGAATLSSMAARLEAAAQDGEIAYVDGNIDDFLTEFNKLLESLRPIVNSYEVETVVEAGGKTSGDVLNLKEKLAALELAAELADIGKIEAIMKELNKFLWSENIAAQLNEINENLGVFDYDGVLECTGRLNNLC